MAPLERRRLGDRLLDVCFSVLIGALALYGAVWLLRAVWPELVMVAVVGGCVIGLVAWWRGRYARW